MHCATVVKGALVVGPSVAGPCADGELVLYTQYEFFQNTSSPFRLSVADGAAVSALIVSVWVAAAIWRWMIRAVYSPSTDA